jgi:peptide-methionine (R)-S-oxide reductase
LKKANNINKNKNFHMKNLRRKTLKLLSFSYLSVILLPYNLLYSVTKKIINPNLSEEQKRIMFNESTERPFTSPLNNEKRKGFFHCANCGAKLFASSAKFDSGTGWPSFTESLPDAFKTKIDYSLGMKRIEYHCANCGVHHGHVFDDGPGSSQKRFCNNGLCLLFKPE